MKRFTFILLLFLITINVLPTYAADSDFEIDENGVLTNYYGQDEEVIIPDVVREIGYGAFSYNGTIKKVFIQDNVTSIEKFAFDHCSNLESITIPDSVTYIHNWAFMGCDKLTINTMQSSSYACQWAIGKGYKFDYLDEEDDFLIDENGILTKYKGYKSYVEIPDNVRQIGESAFSGNDYVNNVIILNGVTSIGNYAFMSCENLTNITIPDSVTSIGQCAFLYCYGLKNLTLPNSIISIGASAFMDCSGLETITIPDGVVSIGDTAFWGCINLKSITIPNSVTLIGAGAFRDCNSLENITIPNSVTSINGTTFYNCSNLESITIPDSVTSIYGAAFTNCSSLNSITIPDSVTFIAIGAIPSTTSIYAYHYTYAAEWALNNNMTLNYLDEAEPGWNEWHGVLWNLDESVLHIKRDLYGDYGTDYPWREYNNLVESVILEDGVKEIGNSYFSNFLILNSITIPDSITTIGNYAFTGCKTLSAITIPESVIIIGEGAFQDCDSIKTITIPNSITTIESYTFKSCANLASITIPDSVTSIGLAAFSDCDKLFEISIPDSIITIGPEAFSYCDNLQSVHLPNNLESIEYYLFLGCGKLKNILIPDSVSEIGIGAFQDCKSLTEISIPNGVTFIDIRTFSGCSNLKDIILPDSVTSIAGSTWNVEKPFYNCRSLTQIKLPENLQSIGEYAFDGSGLTEVIIPNGMTLIGPNTFSGAWSLQNVTLPDTLKVIEDNAFSSCPIEKIMIPESVKYIAPDAFRVSTDIYTYPDSYAIQWAMDNGHKLYVINDDETITVPNPFIVDDEGILIEYYGNDEEIVIPDTVISIGENVFQGNETVKRVVIPVTVISIGNNAFRSCSSLTNITIPESVTSIGNDTFRSCSNLSNITIPESVTSIGSYAFMDDSSLEEILLPDNLEFLGDGAFKNCTSLKEITLPSKITSINLALFSGCTGMTKLVIPESIVSISIPNNYRYYEDYPFYNCSIENLTIPAAIFATRSNYSLNTENIKTLKLTGDMTEISDGLYSGLSSLESVDIPDTVMSIGNSAFSGCTSLASITIPNSVTIIGDYAFYKCISLENITIPESVTSIGSYAFMDDSSLEEILLPDNLEFLGDGAFKNCTSLKEITLPNKITSINLALFSGCTGMTKLVIPDAIVSISTPRYNNADYPFYNCFIENLTIPAGIFATRSYISLNTDNIKTLTLTGDMTEVSDGLYSGLSLLESVDIPDTVTLIGDYAFYDCSSLTSIVIPDSVTSIGDYAFYGCSGLSQITLPDDLESLGEGAFENCTGLSEFVIPVKINTISQNLLLGCTNLRKIVILGSANSFGSGSFENCNIEDITAPVSFFSAISALIDYGYNFVPIEKIKTVTLTDTVAAIPNKLFSNFSALESFDIPETVTSIGNSAFSDCTSLAAITIPDGVTSIGANAFDGCGSLTNIDLSGNITSIGSYAFRDTALTTVTIPAGVNTISDHLFDGCANLSSVNIPDSVETIEMYAFNNCPSLESIAVPASVTSIGNNAISAAISGTWGSAAFTYAKDNGLEWTTSSYPEDYIPAESIVISGPDAVPSGSSGTYSVTINPSDASEKAVTWTSSDENVAEVTSFLSSDQNTVVVTAYDVTDYTTVKLTAASVEDEQVIGEKEITVYPSGLTLTIMDGDEPLDGLSVLGIDLNAHDPSRQLSCIPSPDMPVEITWRSDDESIAAVDETGLVRGIAPGNTVIFAMDSKSGVTKSVNVSVYRYVIGISFTGPESVVGGKSFTVYADVSPEQVEHPILNWTISDTSIGRIANTGLTEQDGKTLEYCFIRTYLIDEDVPIHVSAAANDDGEYYADYPVMIIPASSTAVPTATMTTTEPVDPTPTPTPETGDVSATANGLYDHCQFPRQIFTVSLPQKIVIPVGTDLPYGTGTKFQPVVDDAGISENYEFWFLTRKCTDESCSGVEKTSAYLYSIYVSDGSSPNINYQNTSVFSDENMGTRTGFRMRPFGTAGQPFAVSGLRFMVSEPGKYVIYTFAPFSETSNPKPNNFLTKIFVTVNDSDSLMTCSSPANNGYFNTTEIDISSQDRTTVYFSQTDGAEEAWIQNKSPMALDFPFSAERSVFAENMGIFQLNCQFEALASIGAPEDGVCTPENIHVPPYTKALITGGAFYFENGMIEGDYDAVFMRMDTYNIMHLFVSVTDGSDDHTCLELPADLQTIGSEAFRWINVSSVLLPEGINYIGPQAFNPDVTIKAPRNSYAANWALENGYELEYVDDSIPPDNSN